MLKPGSILTFSAGSRELNPEKYRVIQSSHGLLESILKKLPKLLDYLSKEQPPMIINCYPSPIGTFSNAIFLDTYLRWQNFARAMMLAHQEKLTPIIIAQPLLAMDFLLRYQNEKLPFPKKLIVGLGGYTCSQTLENSINAIASHAGSSSCVSHGYGTGEAGFDCLAGLRNTASGEVIYKAVIDHIQPVIKSGELYFNDTTLNKEFSTGDFAETVEGDGLIIRNSPERLDPNITTLFKTWNEQDWKRRTGFISKQNGEFIFQLRVGETPKNKHELAFYDYACQFPFSWLDKPNWGLTD